MVVGRAIRAVGCTYRRTSVLRSFTSPAFVGRVGLQPPIAPWVSTGPKLFFSSRATEDNEEQEVVSQTANPPVEEENRSVSPQNNETSNTDSSTLPWYLQVRSPERQPQPLSDRQRIPDLPPSPPPILHSLLQHISIDLGLDDLSLLDLRNLDPPPALGAHVLMIIGTARSEKHLHVSADRLCRWLRSMYKLRPDADGLLGRNELKLKLKRKTRRAKLLGNGALDDGDDGIRTGWVCVNVGVVDSGVPDFQLSEEKTFVGFGRQRDGVRIVVQLMTHEKREEINLEQLWGGIIQRGSVVGPEAESGDTDSNTSPVPTLKSSSAIPSPRRPGIRTDGGSTRFPHSRQFHTVSNQRIGRTEDQSNQRDISILESNPVAPSSPILDLESSIFEALSSGDFENAKKLSIDNVDTIGQKYEKWEHFLLSQLRLYLQSIPEEKALMELGNSVDNYRSTPLLKSFYSLMPRFLGEAEWQETVLLSCYAHQLGHPAYTTSALIELLSQLQASGAEVGRDVYHSFICSLLRSDEGDHQTHLAHIIQILQTMYDRGINILNEELLITIQLDSLDRLNEDTVTFSDPVETFDLLSLKLSSAPKRLHSILTMVDLAKSDELYCIKLLYSYAKKQYWGAFWDYWRSFARHRQPRSAALYATMFRCVAESRNQAACMNVLRTWVPEMNLESPVVVAEGPVLDAIQACVEVANQPDVEASVKEAIAAGNRNTVAV
ncbi:hypothetical protein F5884DRAFT_706293 [Xylogone sp. PMI_703]|nr:hypothetical protein F5884DRAFT_706293 [Xylogone sp. PMI_703]